MTAISRPPLAALFNASPADFFATFTDSAGTPVPIESVIGYRSSDMTPQVAFPEKTASGPQASSLIAAPLAALPQSGIILSRTPIAVGNFVYRTDGRKIASLFDSSLPTIHNGYFNERILAKIGPTSFGTVSPQTLVQDSSDVAFANGTYAASAVQLACSDLVGNVFALGATPGGPPLRWLAKWTPSGAVAWMVPIAYPTGQTSLFQFQIDCDANGDVYLMVEWVGSGPPLQSSLRKYASASGAQIWEMLWTSPDPVQRPAVGSFWVSKTFPSVFVTRQLNSSPSGAHVNLPIVEAYSQSAGSLQWSTTLWPSTGAQQGTNDGGGICEVSGLLLAGYSTFGVDVTAAVWRNLSQINQSSGAIIQSWFIGTYTSYPYWLEPLKGRIGTFLQ